MATPDTPRLRNSALQLELLPDGRLTLTRLADGVRFTQEPLEGTVSALIYEEARQGGWLHASLTRRSPST